MALLQSHLPRECLYAVSTFGSTDEKRLLDQGKKYMKQLDPVKALLGHSMKWPHYQAQRVLDQIPPAQKNSALAMEICSQKQLIQSCEELATFELPKEKRDVLLEEITGSVDPLPLAFQEKLVVQSIKENELLNSDDVNVWANAVLPYQRG